MDEFVFLFELSPFSKNQKKIAQKEKNHF